MKLAYIFNILAFTFFFNAYAQSPPGAESVTLEETIEKPATEMPATETPKVVEPPTEAAQVPPLKKDTDPDRCGKSDPAAPARAIPAIADMKEVLRQLKLERFKGEKGQKTVKIAILDNGFSGFTKEEVGKSLPAKTRYCHGKESQADAIGNPSIHGTFMAQLVSQVIANSGAEIDYELFLYNAYGYTKFARAVDFVIENSIDIVLYSQVWEYGGNGDGKGFINALVDKAVAAGVIWINATGFFGKTTRIAKVEGRIQGDSEWVLFGSGYDARFDCLPVQKEKTCKVRVVLSWNDFKNDAATGTDKDLDLYLYNQKDKKPIATSLKVQKMVTNPKMREESLFPRELLETEVPKGIYRVRVKINSKNFSPNHDSLRLTVSGQGVALQNPTTSETLLPPADNKGVIAIGASDDSQSGRSVKDARPDVNFKSKIKLKDGSIPFSTSNAAALAAGLATIHLALDAEKNRDDVVLALKSAHLKTPPKKKERPQPKGPSVPAPATPTPPTAEVPPATKTPPDAQVPPLTQVPPTKDKPATATPSTPVTPSTPATGDKPKAETPKAAEATPPKAEAPKAETPKAETPKAEPPKVASPARSRARTQMPTIAQPGAPRRPYRGGNIPPQDPNQPPPLSQPSYPPGYQQPYPQYPQQPYPPSYPPSTGYPQPYPQPYPPSGPGLTCLQRQPLPVLYANACTFACAPDAFTINYRGVPAIVVPPGRLQNIPLQPGFRLFVTPAGLQPVSVRVRYNPPPNHYELLTQTPELQICR